MDVHEYQAKELLAQFGVPVPKGAVAFSPDQAVYAATELGGWNWAVKAQIHAGARGKAGGIKLCKTYHEVREAASDMLGKRLVTIQTGPEGKPVQRVYIEVAEPFELGVLVDDLEGDRAAQRRAMPEAAEDFDLVGLNPLPSSAAIAPLAPPQFDVDRTGFNRDAGRKSIDQSQQRLAM